MTMMLQIDTQQIPRRPMRVHGLNGEKGLILAVIWRAYADLIAPDPAVRKTALDYFQGDLYQRDLAACDLPSDFLPTGISRVQ